MQSFIENIDASNINSQGIIQALQLTHEALRRTFLAEIASYACLSYCKLTGKTIGFVVGDCRIGSQLSIGSNIKWVSPVHTLFNKEGQDFSEDMLRQPESHVLTRSLNARRFSMPDIIEIPSSKIMLIATDGYWKSSILAQDSTKDDDVSRLEIDFGVVDFEFNIQSNVDNIYIRNVV